MNAFQRCRDTSNAVPLYLPQQLYLKPSARMNISVQLPEFQKLVGKSVSNLEIMDQLRNLIQPEKFLSLTTTKSTVEFVRFEAEMDDRKTMEKAVARLENRMIKLKDFKEHFKVRAAEAKSDFPSAHAWDTFFRDAKDMDEMKPGCRPDTVHLSGLPIKWFVPFHLSNEEDAKPSEKVFYRVFEKFGGIRNVDIPICDPYRSKMKSHITGIKMHSVDDKKFFEGYVQFKDYIGFARAMDAFRGMKLVKKEEDEMLGANIKVDFDTTRHLSDASIKRREIVRDRLIEREKAKEEKLEKEKEEIRLKEEQERKRELERRKEKEQRRRLREEKRKAKILEKLKITGADEINAKIAREEKKLLKAQRKLEAIRLVEELFKRIKEKRETDLITKTTDSRRKGKVHKHLQLSSLKASSEMEVNTLREKLHEAIEGRVILKNMLSRSRNKNISSTSSDDSSVERKKKREKFAVEADPVFNPYNANWFSYDYSTPNYYPPQMYPPIRPDFQYNRGRIVLRGGFPGPSRGRFRPYGHRGRGYRPRDISRYPPDLRDAYIKYFSKFLDEGGNHHDDRDRRSYSRSKSRSLTRSRTRSHSRKSRSRRRKSESRSSSRRRSPSRSSSRRSWSMRRRSRRSSSSCSSRRRSSSKRSKRKAKSKSNQRRSRSESFDSSKFISPRSMKERSKKDKRSSWSKTPELL